MSLNQLLSGSNKWSSIECNDILIGAGSALNYFEEYSATGATLSGIYAAPVACVYKITQVGNLVNLHVPSASGTQNTGANASLTALPARFRPAADVYLPMMVNDGGTVKQGVMVITASTGAMTIGVSAASGNFANTGTGGLNSTSVSYQVA